MVKIYLTKNIPFFFKYLEEKNQKRIFRCEVCKKSYLFQDLITGSIVSMRHKKGCKQQRKSFYITNKKNNNEWYVENAPKTNIVYSS